jgi:hypothetical protein
MRLFFLLYSIVATALSGTAIVVVLAAGLPGWQPIVAAQPPSARWSRRGDWIAARKISTL